MKYIKEYNHVDKIVELSEYLQEIFDEFSISYGEDRLGASSRSNGSVCWEMFHDSIFINNGYDSRFSMTDIYQKIKNRLKERHEYLENRLDSGIRISYYDDEIEISID